MFVKDKIFFEMKKGTIKLVNDDFLKTDAVDENSIDLIVTSPPYNVDIRYNSFQDDIPYERYLENFNPKKDSTSFGGVVRHLSELPEDILRWYEDIKFLIPDERND